MNEELKDVKLFDLVGDYERLYEMADDPDMEGNAEAWFDTMESIEGEIEDKAVNYYHVIRNLEADAAEIEAKAEAFKEEYERLTAIAATKRNSVKRIKQSLTKAMVLTGKVKFKNDNISFWTATTKSVELSSTLDIDKVPTKYLKFKNPDIDKKLLKEDLTNGMKCDFAKIVENTGVRFR